MVNYYIVKVSGKNTRRFISKLFKLDVSLYDINYYKDYVIFKVSYEDYLKIKSVKSIYKIDLVGIKGIKKLKMLLKKYQVFLCFFIIGLFLIIISSKFIFFISVDHPKKEIRDLIVNELKDNNITLFTYFKNSNIKMVKEKIKSKHKDKIEWLEIKHDGVFLKISVIERILEDNNQSLEKKDIVALKNGMILDMYVTSGDILKNKGDYVSKGDVIVSGIIKRNDDIVDIKDAKARVYAEVWYKVNVNASYNYYDDVTLNKGYRSLNISIFNKNIKLIGFKKKNIKDNNKVIFKSSLMSIYINDSLEHVKTLKKYSDKELEERLEGEALKNIEDKLKSDEYVLMQKTLKKYKQNGKMYLEVFFKTYEDIACSKTIDELDVKNIDRDD